MKISTKYARTGLLQASGLVIYVFLVVNLIHLVENLKVNPPDLVAGLTFVLTFVTSALICGSIALFYPATLALSGKVRDAVEVVVWTGAWMIAIVLILLTLILTLAR